jgi:dienelactone hydrolase
MRVLAALLGLLLAGTAQAQPLPFNAETVGPQGTGAPHRLFLPVGSGPHPAVVVMHGCSGITPTNRTWAERLAQNGFVAVLPDSFRPRGETNVCGRTNVIVPRQRAEDAFAAAAYLRARPDVDGARVFAVGFSHGGSTVLAAASASAVAREGAVPFRAVVAFYPWCPLAGAKLASPVLTLVGSEDDWTPASRCERLQAAWRPEFGVALLHVYPGATHSFDSPAAERRYLGHLMRPDPAATADAGQRMLAFFANPP